MKILVVNGPNLNLLGKRQPEIYGSQSFTQYFESLQQTFPIQELVYFQSNHEGELIDFIQKEGFSAQGLVINAGGFTHTSVALADAISAVSIATVEVHISNIFAREAFRQHSYLSPVSKGIISGLGLYGYKAAIDYFIQHSGK
jgi:3-dehydroquinate dehydratase-2